MSYDLDTLHGEMLAEMPDRYQKTIGFPAWDLTRAFALAVCSLREDLDIAVAATNVDNMTGDELTRWCRQRKGVVRREATYAGGTITVLAGNGVIYVGDLFESGGGIQFTAIETKTVSGGDTVAVRAVEPGPSGNVAAGSVTRMPVSLAGISKVSNEQAMSGGYAAESDDSLRARYYQEILSPAASGNKNAYKAWALEVSGVGRARVFPLAGGDNTVTICILGSDMAPADDTLVAAVQEHIDPGRTGSGEGCAPVGAYCTVEAAAAKVIDVACSVTLTSGYSADEVLDNVAAAVRAYLAEVAFVSPYVSYAKIANAVNDADGVFDYTGLTVNGGTANIALEEVEAPVLGAVSIT